MNVTELHITALQGMKRQAEDKRDKCFQLAEQIKHEGEILAYERNKLAAISTAKRVDA